MRRAMADAEVGDDQYGEDPSVNRLQEDVAALLGTEASLFMPSGTMTNQVALRTLTRPGDDVLVPTESHVVLHETGAGAANAGVQFSPIGERGLYDADAVRAAVKPAGHIVYPPTTLLVTENTHNRGWRHRLPGRCARRGRGCGTRARPCDLPGRSPDPQRRHRQRTTALGAGGRLRPRRDVAVEGSRCAGWLDAGRVPETSSGAPIAIGAWQAARCARPGSSPRPAPTPWPTTSTDSPTTTQRSAARRRAAAWR